MIKLLLVMVIGTVIINAIPKKIKVDELATLVARY